MMTSSTVTISRYTGGADDALHAIWEATVASLHPAYTLSTTKMSQLLGADNAVTFVAREGDSDAILGYTLTYTIRAGAVEPASQHLKGTLSILAVARDAQGRGVGSALHDAALEHLTSVVRGSLSRSTPPAADSTISLGSIFPRVFPGLPVLDAFKPARAWFERRGWVFDANTSIDLYGKLPNDVDLDKFKEQAHSHSIVFRPAKPEDEEKLMVLQKEFDSFTGWPDMFPKFLRAGKAGDIHLAIRKDGEIIGATLAALSPSPMHDSMAWADMLGSWCGAVGCVGVSARSRGEGAGVGMVAAAIQDLERRGADGVFIDWVGMKGFYERFGPTKWEAAYWGSTRKVTSE